MSKEKRASREQCKQTAEETLKIQQQGYYLTPSNRRIDISAQQKLSEEKSRLITPAEGKELVQSLAPSATASRPTYEVKGVSTVHVIAAAGKAGEALGVLNFASAKNPGGGFLNGAMAQEEALAASSGLYNTLLRHETYYEKNRAHKSAMYTDYAVYSPEVVFFRDSSFSLLAKPVCASILTLPAVNMGQVREKGEDVRQAKQVMKERMRLCLAIFAHEERQTIVLGAYGCGVFQNDPAEVANWWHELLLGENYGAFFDKVIFAILDHPQGENITSFKRAFC
jgi:uncharacterized protein (TIGR02452 family)